MKSPIPLLLFALIAIHHDATASIVCNELLPASQSFDERHECSEIAAKQAELAKKMLTQRLAGLVSRIERAPDSDPRLANMADVATNAKVKLKEISTDATKAAKAHEEATDLLLKLKSTKEPAKKAETLANELQAMAKKARALESASEEAEKQLNQSIAKLANATSFSDQMELITKVKKEGEFVEKAKADAAKGKKELVSAATDMERATLDSTTQTEKHLAEKINEAYKLNRKIVATGNAIMLDMMGPFDQPVRPTSPGDKLDRQKQRQLSFLMFLESHPLLNSEVSGSGVQIASTAGEGKVTIKSAFQMGRTSSQKMSLALSAPINKGAESDMSPAKNNVLLDKLAGDTTIKGDYTFLGTLANTNNNGLHAFWLAGVSAEVGYQEFSYFNPATSFVDPANPVKVSDHNESYALATYAGFSPFDSKTLFLLRFSRQYEREGQKAVAICPPLAAGASYVTCQSGVLGEPKGKKFNIMSLEGRRSFNNFAISGTISYDRTSKVRAIAIPLHFSVFNRGYGSFGAGEPQFSAGVIYGWRSDTGSSFGVFAGVPFSLAGPN